MKSTNRETVRAQYRVYFNALPCHERAAELVGMLRVLSGGDVAKESVSEEACALKTLDFTQQVTRVVQEAGRTWIDGLAAQIADKFAAYDYDPSTVTGGEL